MSKSDLSIEIDIRFHSQVLAKAAAGMIKHGYDRHATLSQKSSSLQESLDVRGMSMDDFIERRRAVSHWQRDGYVAQLLLEALHEMDVISIEDFNEAWERVLDAKQVEREVQAL